MLRKTYLQRKTALRPKKPMKKRRTKDKRTAAEKLYYAWLATQECVDTGAPCEQRHHMRKQRYGAGGSKKALDWFAVPISIKGHDWAHEHIDEGFDWLNPFIPQLWQRYGLDKVPKEVQALYITPEV